MRVIEKLMELELKKEELTERYCENCQEYDCDCCWAEVTE